MFFLAIYKISTIQKKVLSSSRGQGNFRGLKASRPRPRTSKCLLVAKDVLEDSTSDRKHSKSGLLSLSKVESPGHILKSLALASKVNSLASRPQVLENWPVLGSRTALFFELLKFCGALEKFYGKRFFVEIAWKIFVKTFFFGEHLRLCPWFLALASGIPILGLESVCPRKGCPWPWPRIFFVSLALASSLVSSTPPLITTFVNT